MPLGRRLRTRRDGCVASAAAQAMGPPQVKRIVKVNGYIACTHNFTELPFVLNGCSDLMAEVFAERGVHARAAVGVTTLPLGVPVEIDLVAEIEP
jgi:enamine deaminase RidA (YjgF/YER057c/UK114 family)